MKHIFKYLIYTLSALIGGIAMSACQDDWLADDPRSIPEGVSTVSVEVAFKAFEPALGNSRSAGDAIKRINTLWVAVFDINGENPKFYPITDFTVKDLDTNARPDGQPSSESKTGCAKFKLTIPNGMYKMYAVVNYDLTPYVEQHPAFPYFVSKDESITSSADLKALYFKWNSDDVSKNAQMFGWFVNGTAKDDHGDDAQIVTIRSNNEPLHAWVRRAASKVTIAFNTTNLSDYVTLYIKSVTIKDIPQYCRLDMPNAPGHDDYKSFEEMVEGAGDLIDGETIYFKGASKEDKDAKAAHTNWTRIFTGDRVFGLFSDAVGKAPDDMSVADCIDREHTEDARALYFFENLQGEGMEGTVTDKRQDVSGNNTQVSYPDGGNSDNEAWKDGKPKGSYIEIEGYYENSGTSSPGQGPITYRFMLGKDEIKDYNAERNYHYKVTLTFHGNANEVDFHIDYQEENTPGLHVQDVTYVSYLYNQESHTVLRATPKPGYDLLSLEAYILDNEWRPYNGEDVIGQWPNSSSLTTKVDQYLYNKDAWKQQVEFSGNYVKGAGSYNRPDYEVKWTDENKKVHTEKCANNTEFGFLSLRKVSTQIYEMNGGANQAFIGKLRKLYFLGNPDGSGTSKDRSRGYRNYGDMPSSDGTVTVGTDEDGKFDISRQRSAKGVVQYIMEIPLYTRAKCIDSWGVFSGANPFYCHFRMARVIFIAKYKNATTGDTYQEADITTVYQARRIDNPRTIYRSAKNTDPFEVTLCYNTLTAAEQLEQINELDNDTEIYEPIISMGPWTATIERDPNQLVSISANGRTVTRENQSITGRSGTPIRFTYKPMHSVADDVAEGAIITVKYHGNSCSHKILVRQGFAPTTIGANSKTLWSAYTVYKSDSLSVNPLSVGSSFRMYKDLSYPIAENNNNTFKFNTALDANDKLEIIGGSPTAWASIPANDDSKTGNASVEFVDMNLNGKQYTLPTIDNLIELGIYKDKTISEDKQNAADRAMVQDIGNAFGIAYGDGAKTTLKTKLAYTFVDYDNKLTRSERGVRGVTVYSLETGNNVFFPFGAWGNPRRRRDGLLQYGSVNWLLLGDGNNCRPMAYSLVNQIGGCFWITGGEPKKHVAIDFNGGNYMSSYLNSEDVYQTSNKADALLIKPIVK